MSEEKRHRKVIYIQAYIKVDQIQINTEQREKGKLNTFESEAFSQTAT